MYSVKQVKIFFSMVSFDISNGKFKYEHFLDNSVTAFLQMMMIGFEGRRAPEAHRGYRQLT